MFDSLTELKQWFYKYAENPVKFHFQMTNIMLLIQNDHRDSEFYCFCHNIEGANCGLCKMSDDFHDQTRNARNTLNVSNTTILN